MVFSNDSLLAQYRKRSAESGGSRPQARPKKQKQSADQLGDVPSQAAVTDPARERKKGKEPRVEGALSTVIQAPPAPTHPTSSSQGSRRIVRLRRSGPESSSGPGVSSSSRPQPLSSSGTNPPSSSRDSSGREKRQRDTELMLEDGRAIEDADVAREVVHRAMLPADRAFMEAGEVGRFIDQVYCSAVKHLHEIDMLVNAASSYQQKALEGEQKAKAAEKRMREAEAKAEAAEARAKEMKSKLEGALELCAEEKANHALTQSTLENTEARRAGLESELEGQKYRNGLLCLKLDQLESRVKKAEERANKAVENFRASEEYRNELMEEAVDGLIRGFDDCRTQIKRICPKWDFSDLQPCLSYVAGENSPLVVAEDEDDALPEVIPEAAPEVASEMIEIEDEVPSEVAPEIIPAAAPESVPGVASEIIQDPVPELAPEI